MNIMLVSTRMGLIACRYLTETYYRNEWATAPEIAERYNINVRSLMSALRGMARAGILKSRVGGTSPGFMFAMDPRDISILQVTRALEKDVEFDCCKNVISGLKCDCGDNQECGIFSVMNEIIRSSLDKLSSISIAEHAEKDFNGQF